MVAGSLALRARERGAWVAPANEVLRGIVALEPALSRDRWGDLQEAQVNALRQEPRGFLVLSSDTLSRDPELVGIQVRRLLALLRRAALRLGAGYVFEPLSPALRRMVERGFTELLTGLFARGAFAGTRPERAFQVDAGVLADGRRDEERGRFFVELRVAPSTPLRFLRVRLVQGGERALVTEGS
jgi:phage tail sheath protein FI